MRPITPTSYDGCNYIITFLNDYTYFTAAYLLKSKTEVFYYFKVWSNGHNAFQLQTKQIPLWQRKKIHVKWNKTVFWSERFLGWIHHKVHTGAEWWPKSLCDLIVRNLWKGKMSTFEFRIEQEFLIWDSTNINLLNRSPTSALKGEVPATM